MRRIVILDDDELILNAMAELVKDNGLSDESVERIQYTKSFNKEKVKRKIEEKEILLIDLFLKGQEETRVPYERLTSVLLAKELKKENLKVIFYSNSNERGVDDLLALEPKWGYLPISGNAFMKENKKRYDKYQFERDEYVDFIRTFTGEKNSEADGNERKTMEGNVGVS